MKLQTKVRILLSLLLCFVMATSVPAATSDLPPWFPKAPSLPPPKGEVIRVATAEELLAAVDRAEPGRTILLADGHYRLSRVIVLREKKDLTIRSATEDPIKVTLSGKGWDS